MITIKALRIYPFKSCGEISVQSIAIHNYGFDLDRHYVVIESETSKPVSGDLRRKLTQIRVLLIGDHLTISHPSHGLSTVKVQPTGINQGWCRPHLINIYGKSQIAFDQGDQIAGWLSNYLGKPCRLLRTHPSNMPTKAVDGGRVMTVAGHDSSSIHLLSEASLSGVTRRLSGAMQDNQAYNALSPARFRPNIIVGGDMRPFDEDDWGMIRIGENVILQVSKKTERCGMIDINPDTGEAGGNLLKTLNHIKPGTKGPEFGIYLYPLQTGLTKVGDEVFPL